MVALYRVDLPPAQLGVELGPATARQILDRRGDVFAVLDGPMFDGSGPQYTLRDKSRDIDVRGRFPTRGVIFCVVGGRVAARRGGLPMAGSTVCVQTYPSLVEAGAVTASQTVDTDLVGRAALVLRRDGGVSLVAARAASMRAFAEAIADQLDALWAGYTDGGSSTSLVSRQALLLDPQQRRLPSWVVARMPPAAVGAAAPGAFQISGEALVVGGSFLAGVALYTIGSRSR